jgi:hypothetical protein
MPIKPLGSHFGPPRLHVDTGAEASDGRHHRATELVVGGIRLRRRRQAKSMSSVEGALNRAPCDTSFRDRSQPSEQRPFAGTQEDPVPLDETIAHTQRS